MNTFGKILQITTFGESHGVAVGVTIDGFPSNFKINLDFIKQELDRRKTGQSRLVSQRKELEEFEIVSGVFDGKTTGHPIMIIIYNSNAKSKDYDNVKNLFRPNHADLTYHQKYGIRDYKGGGRSSARETTSRVLAGSIAKQFLKEKFGTEIFAYTKQVGKFIAKNIDLSIIENNAIRTADSEIADDMIKLIANFAGNGDTIGGILECTVKNPLKNLGEPTFGKIKARLADAMLSIGAVQGFEYGAGFDVINETGNSYNEGFTTSPQCSPLGGEGVENFIHSPNNNYGGILGGITTGEDIIFRIAVKPTSSIYKPQKTADIDGNSVEFQIRGRHDPCILPRVVPIVESMVALVLMDLYLIDKSKR
ncbi:MAG: chorismate synthase [Candidatus Gracilibacteria bacterium]|nr:chorismate synthase [Candidatus Gracilibacteria bacterium]